MKLGFNRNLSRDLKRRRLVVAAGFRVMLAIFAPLVALFWLMGGMDAVSAKLASNGSSGVPMVRLANSRGPVESVTWADQELAIPGGDGVKPGKVFACLPNEARLTESNYQQPLTDYVIGWTDSQGTEETLNKLFPIVDVGRRFEYKALMNGEAFLSESDDIRAIGSDFKRVRTEGESVESSTQNKGLMIRLDKDNFPINSQGIRERMAARLKDRLLLNDLRRGVGILLGINAGTSKTWTTTQDPDADMHDLIEAAGLQSGLDPNTLVIGRNPWSKRFKCYRAQNNAGAYGSAALTPDQLSDLLQIDNVSVLKQRYATQKTATSKTVMLGDYVVATYIEQNPMLDDPSSMKRFVSPTEQGGQWATYVIESAKFVDIIVEHYSRISQTASVGTKRYNIS